MEQPKSPRSDRGVIFAIIGMLLCICVLLLVLGGTAYYYIVNQTPTAPAPPTPGGNENTQQPPVIVTSPPASSVPTDSLATLAATTAVNSDPYDLACRLQNICNVSHTLPAPAALPQIGTKQKFWISNVETIQNFQITAGLLYITPHTYFWAQDGVNVNPNDMKSLMDTFESTIYPTDRAFFGGEWSPGVDNDPHIYILYARGTGASNAGYFSSPDELNPLINKYSNGHEMFVFNADNLQLSSQETYSVLAHEFQHMIRWNLDQTLKRSDSTWMNEGFSMLAEFLNHYPVYFDENYVQAPDLNLTDWLPDLGADTPHYGEAFMFLDYFLNRFGQKTVQSLVNDPQNGLPAVDDTLKNLNITDPQTGKPVTADDVTLDWMVANYVKDASVGDGRYAYSNYPDVPQTQDTQKINTCPQAPLGLSVNQYGAEYVDISCTGKYTLSFNGSTLVHILPTDAHSGKYFFWSNTGDASNMTLTRNFDFTSTPSPIQMSYSTWYDLEPGYDYAYLEASTDGQHWQILKTPSCSNNDTSGNAYGCGYTAKSGGGTEAQWLNESIDLSAYAGKKVQLRFEYVTDAAVNLLGLALDDISIPAINYSSDFETDDGGWQANGFARIENVLPQTFRVAIVVKGGSKTSVQDISLSPDQTADIPLALTSGENAVLVVTGVQRYSRLTAAYNLSIK
jgi:immune inhibitor A